MPCVGCHGSRIESPSADEFCNGHSKVGQQTDARDAHSWIAGIGRGEICVVVMVVVMSMARVAVTMAMTAMIASLLERRPHDCRERRDAATDRGQMKQAAMGSCRVEREIGARWRRGYRLGEKLGPGGAVHGSG